VKRYTKLTLGEQWLDTAWEVARDAEREFKVSIAVALLLSPQRGVWNVHATALNPDLVEGAPVERCSVTRPFPTARTAMMEATIYQVVTAVSTELFHQAEREKESRAT